MKRIIALILVLLLSLTSMVGCDKIPGLDKVETKFNEVISSIRDLIPGLGNDDKEENPDANVTYDVKAAAEYVKSLYIEGASKTEEGAVITAGDYEVVAQVMVAGVKYVVDWSVDNDKVKLTKNETTWTVDVDNKAKEAHNYNLTATVTAGDGSKETVTFFRHVPKYNVISFEEYMKAEKGDTVTVEGIVVAINSISKNNKRNHLFLADASGKGGYYSYQMDKDPIKDLGIEIGMTVSVTGPVEPYSGMQEIKGGSATIVDSSIKTVAPVDITSIVAPGADYSAYVALPVTIKGVTIGSQALEKDTDQYLYFEINGVKSYIRTYVTDLPTTLNLVKDDKGVVSSPDKTTIDKAHAEHFGYTANVTGILVLFNSTPYLIPMSTDCFEYLTYVEKTPAEKIASELGELTFENSISVDTVIDLLLKGKNYDEVTFEWSSDNAAIVIADGKATVTVPEETTTVKVTVKATCGEATETKVFEIKLSKSLTPVKEAIEIGAAKDHNTYTEGKYLVAGIITEVYNTQYGNMYITDADGNVLTVYGTYDVDGTNRYDAMTNKPVAGDYVVLLGVLGQYNDTPQMKNAWILSYTTPTSVKDAIDLGAAKDHNDFTGDKILVTGTITEVYNTQYGNMYITDAEGNVLTIYGTYDATGVNRYDAMANKPVAGDVVTILGVPGRYNDTKQIKNGWIVDIVPAAEAAHTCADANNDYICDDAECGKVVLPEADSVLTIPQAIALANALGAGNYTSTKYYITATVEEVYNTTYGNMNVVDADGNKYVFYGAYDAEGNRYDAMEVKPVAGDVITLYGVVGSYKNSKTGEISYQLKDGTVTKIEGAEPHVCEFVAGETVAPTCTTEGYTVYACSCGKTENRDVKAALNHEGTKTETETVEATCVKDGYTKVTCECGEVLSNVVHPATDHDFSNGDTCANGCGTTKEHVCEFVAEKVVDPTCTEAGYTVYVCSCGKTENRDEKQPLNHVGTETTTETKEATCTEAGSVTVTCECGEVLSTETKEKLEHKDEDGDFLCDYGCKTVLAPAADSVLTIEQALALGALTTTTDKYYITGMITEVYNTQYGNMYITDGTNTITIYGTYSADGTIRYDAMEVKPVAYDTVTVYGILTSYKGNSQMKDGRVTAHTAHVCEEYNENHVCPVCGAIDPSYHVCADADGDFKCDDKTCGRAVVPAAESVLTIPQAIALANAIGEGNFTTDKYYITATIVSVYSTTYGNMNVVDADGNKYVFYGTYSADGSARYDAMSVKPVAYDVVTVYGIVGSYKNANTGAVTFQMKDGWITEHTAHEHDYESVVTDPTCTAAGYTTYTCSVCKDSYKVDGEAATGHTMVDGECSVCGHKDGEAPAISTLATFTLGTDADGAKENSTAASAYTETNNGYTLTLQNLTKVYNACNDANGNSVLKLGTSSAAGSFSFTVDANVTEVIIYVAGYKANSGIKVTVNGVDYTVESGSDTGNYTAIKIDTTTTKTISFNTNSPKASYRCHIDSIVFNGTAA